MHAQAAIEYLATYGWALLVLILSIAALAYFGVIDVGRFVPSHCELSAGLICQDYALTPDGTTLLLANAYGYDLADVNVRVLACNESRSVGRLRNNEQTPVLTFNCTVPKGRFTVSYRAENEATSHTLTGSYALHEEG